MPSSQKSAETQACLFDCARAFGWEVVFLGVVLWQGTPLKHRVDVLYSTVLQAILWGAETWTPTKARLSRLCATHLQMLRSFVKLPKVDSSPEGSHRRIQHDRFCIQFTKKINKPMLDELFLRKYFRQGGHVARMGPEKHAKMLLGWNIAGGAEGQRHQERGRKQEKVGVCVGLVCGFELAKRS